MSPASGEVRVDAFPGGSVGGRELDEIDRARGRIIIVDPPPTRSKTFDDAATPRRW
jgi:hypothetical protein